MSSSMSIVSPIHSLHALPQSSSLIIASSNSVHKYNPHTSSIEHTFNYPEGNYAVSLTSSSDWLFMTGGDKYLRVLNAHTLELVAELYISKIYWLTIVPYSNDQVQLLTINKPPKSSSPIKQVKSIHSHGLYRPLNKNTIIK